MGDHSGTVIESQVDWLTVSAHGEDAASRMLDLARGLAKEEEHKGNKPRDWHLMGYQGQHVGSIEYGQRDKASTLVRAIGQSAADHLDVLVSLADRVPRIDLAVTWRADPPDPLHGRNAYALAEMHHQAHPSSGLPSAVQNAEGGWTTYVGHRASEYFLRVYNKGAEAIAVGDEAGAERYRACWRYELEIKAYPAQRVAEICAQADDRAAFVQDYIYHHARRVGLEPPFPNHGAVNLVPGFRRRSDADAKLAHLAKRVKPTTDWLRTIGREDDLREVLELDRTAGLLRELQGILMRHAARVDMPAEGNRRREGE